MLKLMDKQAIRKIWKLSSTNNKHGIFSTVIIKEVHFYFCFQMCWEHVYVEGGYMLVCENKGYIVVSVWRVGACLFGEQGLYVWCLCREWVHISCLGRGLWVCFVEGRRVFGGCMHTNTPSLFFLSDYEKTFSCNTNKEIKFKIVRSSREHFIFMKVCGNLKYALLFPKQLYLYKSSIKKERNMQHT